MISDVVRRSCAMSWEACQAMLGVLPADVGWSLGVASGGTATTVAAGVPGCCAWAAEARHAAPSSRLMRCGFEIIAPLT